MDQSLFPQADGLEFVGCELELKACMAYDLRSIDGLELMPCVPCGLKLMAYSPGDHQLVVQNLKPMAYTMVSKGEFS